MRPSKISLKVSVNLIFFGIQVGEIQITLSLRLITYESISFYAITVPKVKRPLPVSANEYRRLLEKASGKVIIQIFKHAKAHNKIKENTWYCINSMCYGSERSLPFALRLSTSPFASIWAKWKEKMQFFFPDDIGFQCRQFDHVPGSKQKRIYFVRFSPAFFRFNTHQRDDDDDDDAVANSRRRSQRGIKSPFKWNNNMPDIAVPKEVRVKNKKLYYPPTWKCLEIKAAGIISKERKSVNKSAIITGSKRQRRSSAGPGLFPMTPTVQGGGGLTPSQHGDESEEEDSDEHFFLPDDANTSSSSDSEEHSDVEQEHFSTIQTSVINLPHLQTPANQEEENLPTSATPKKTKSLPPPHPTSFIVDKQVIEDLLTSTPCSKCYQSPNKISLTTGQATVNTIKDMQHDGLCTEYTLTCCVCSEDFNINLNPPKINSAKIPGVNYRAVQGITKVGRSREQLNFCLGVLGCHTLTRQKYDEAMDHMTDLDLQLVDTALKENLAEEIRLTREKNQGLQTVSIDVKELQPIQVAFDGNWTTRGYHSNHGFAVFVGRQTGKIVAIGWKSKYCATCSYYDCRKKEVPEHDCKRNHTESSSSMEPALFMQMMTYCINNGAYIAGYVADGDTKVYGKLAAVCEDLGVPVPQRFQDKNHLIVGLGKKLRKIQKVFYSRCRRALSPDAIKQICNAVTGVIMSWQRTDDEIAKMSTLEFQGRAQSMQGAILNVAKHYFNHHEQCVDTVSPQVEHRCTGSTTIHKGLGLDGALRK